MSVAGLLDAMRSNRKKLSERLVWMCLENHANGARFWSISIRDMASELNLRTATVTAAIEALEEDEIIRCEKRRKHVTIYHMLRVYPPGGGPKVNGHDLESANPPNPEFAWRHEPTMESANRNPSDQMESANRNPSPEIESANRNSLEQMESETRNPNPEIGSGFRHVVESTSKTPPERSSLRSQRARPIPEDWRPSDLDRQYAISHNVDPERAADEFVGHWSNIVGKTAAKLNWSKTFRNRVLWLEDHGAFALNKAAAKDQRYALRQSNIEQARQSWECGTFLTPDIDPEPGPKVLLIGGSS